MMTKNPQPLPAACKGARPKQAAATVLLYRTKAAAPKPPTGYFQAASANIYDGDFSGKQNDYAQLWRGIRRMIEEEKTAQVHRRLNERDAHKQAAAPEAPEASMS